MSPKRIQLLFILGICAITLHFSIRLGCEIFHYCSLQKQAKAEIKQWEIVEVGGRFALKSTYEFRDQKKCWRATYNLKNSYYLNEWAAFEALKEKAKKEWTVWYNPRNPQDSSLENPFPTGMLIRTLICYGVLVYFFCFYKRLFRV